MIKLLPALFLLASSISNTPEKEINYLPDHYIGKVGILFNQPAGNKTEYTGSRRVYRIPACGLLKTNFLAPERKVFNSATLNDDVLFVYTDKAGKIIDTLHFMPDFENGDTAAYKAFMAQNKNKVFVFEWGFAGFSIDDEKYKDVETFIVDTLKNKHKYSYVRFDRSDLDKCR